MDTVLSGRGRFGQQPGSEAVDWTKMFSSRSRFRHVFGSPWSRDQCYEGVRAASNSTSHDATLCAVNTKYLAVVVESTGGGVFLVFPLNKTGRVDNCAPRVCGHSASVNDLKWNPFDDDVIASCSDDTKVKLWRIPEGGLKDNMTECAVELNGHSKRVTQCQWHPTASDILLTTGNDFRCIVWNTGTACAAREILNVHSDVIFSMAWNRSGSLVATTSKDGKIRIIEPRSSTVIASGRGHDGVGRTSKVVFVDGRNRLLTTGFSRTGERQYALWEATGQSLKLLRMEDLDSSSSIMMPYYDYDTHVVFLAGKGDGNIRYYEVISDPPYIRNLNQYQSPSPQRDLAMLPKRGVDPMKGEIIRFYKIHATKDVCEPVSMIIPRKTERFQPEIFPPTAGNRPALSADQWLNGVDKDPILAPIADVNDNTWSHSNAVNNDVTARTTVDVTKREKSTTTAPTTTAIITKKKKVPTATLR